MMLCLEGLLQLDYLRKRVVHPSGQRSVERFAPWQLTIDVGQADPPVGPARVCQTNSHPRPHLVLRPIPLVCLPHLLEHSGRLIG
jgi:hypothetical protein